MTIIYKVLGQASPAASTNTDLYTVPSIVSAVISTLVICNRGAASSSFRVAVRPAGAAIAVQHYLMYDTVISSNDSLTLTIGMTLATTDIVTVLSTSGTISFSLFGSEIA
jgi:hypothetical protein